MKYFLAIIGLLLTVSSMAQDKATIKGKLVDSTSKQPLALATITIFTAKDTTIVTYRLSDPQGNFRVTGLPLHIPCRLVVSFSGYRVFRKTFELTTQQPQLDLGTLPLVHDITALDEVLVLAERPPVSVKKDTIEFNAASFKTLPTALVEDLLKKLPGVELDKDGNITVNGRVVNRILVDGKDFFGGDPKVATRNLPANIIEKVQVTDDKDQLDRDPQMNKADLGQVINLKLKRSIKKGWFGKLYAGTGTDDRYEGGGIVNLFRDTLQVSLLGYTNNLNKPGFGLDDIQRIGGFQRSGSNNVAVSDGGLSVNDISFGGTGQGIQRSTGAGVNLNYDLAKKLTLNLQYFYGQINSQLDQVSNTQQFVQDTALTTRNTTSKAADDYSHRFAAKLRWRPDTLSTIIFEPKLVLKKSLAQQHFFSTASSNLEGLLNESVNEQRSNNEETSYLHEVIYTRSFQKKGRSLFLGNVVSMGWENRDQQNDATNKFYNGQGNTILDQLRNRQIDNYRIGFGGNFIDQINKLFSYRVQHLTEFIKNDDQLQTFNSNQATGKYDIPDPELSNGINRTGTRTNTSLAFRLTVKKTMITIGMTAQTLRMNNDFVKIPDIRQEFFYMLPMFMFTWKQLNFNYRVNVNEPRITDLQPVADNTNPLYVQLGNINLVPTKSHSFNLNFNKYNTHQNVQYSVYLRGNIDEDAVIRERMVDNKGVQIMTPLNVDGTWHFYTSWSIGKQFKYSANQQLTIRAFMSGNYDKNLVIVNKIRSEQESFQLSPNISCAFNWKDKFEFYQRYGIGWNKTYNDNAAFRDVEAITHTSSSEIVVRVPRHWVWETRVDYNYNPQIAPGLQKSNTRWNAAVNFLFLKDDQGQLKLSVYDLLDQNISITRYTRENYIQDNQITVLRRYFLLTFTYNIRNFGTSKVGGRAQLFRF